MKRTIKQYELVRKLGSGASGVVFLANDTLLMRPVVLKILKRGGLSAEEMRASVLREARLASAIEHPNVCAIYEVGEESDEAYIVMQFIPGESLDKLIGRGPAALQLVLSVGIQIADGLSAAHRLHIFHRDLKPANVMLTDGGLVKILDFGLARQTKVEAGEPVIEETIATEIGSGGSAYTGPGGTIAYMAPEQLLAGHSSAQSDIWALGVILYQLVSARHPFARPSADRMESMRAVQYADPDPLADVPTELNSIIMRCLEKTPAQRFETADEIREALKTIMRALQIETGSIPGDAAANLPMSPVESDRRAAGFLSMLAERFRESTNGQRQPNTIVVLPFANLGATEAPLYGFALADAIASRLARMPSLVVRPSSALMGVSVDGMDPLAIGHKLLVQWVLAGSFLRSERGFDLNWQLLDVPGRSVKTGGAISVPSFDLIAVQTEICNEVLASLLGVGEIQTSPERTAARSARLTPDMSEEYLQARAMLSSFQLRTGSLSDLDATRALFERVTAGVPTYAPAWSGLGLTHLEYVRHGFGGQRHVVVSRRAFDRALAIDPEYSEANLYRVYMLLSRGDKESARFGIERLLQMAANDWNVHQVAGVTLRIDGMYEEALDQFGQALMLNPSNAPVIYNHRARVYQYQNQMELAEEELHKGLALEPKHPLLRTSTAYQRMRRGELSQAIAILESVVADDPGLRIAFPTLAICYVQAGHHDRAALLIDDGAMAAAEADGEMAYRLATYFAVDGDVGEALHWLRRAIYLGNENYPWFAWNPAWNGVRGNPTFEKILENLKRSFKRNQKSWKRLLAEAPGPVPT